MTLSWCHNVHSSLLGTREIGRVPVSEKESKRERNRSISPWMKNGRANLSSFCAHTNEWVCICHFSSLSLCTCPWYKICVCASVFKLLSLYASLSFVHFKTWASIFHSRTDIPIPLSLTLTLVQQVNFSLVPKSLTRVNIRPEYGLHQLTCFLKW